MSKKEINSDDALIELLVDVLEKRLRARMAAEAESEATVPEQTATASSLLARVAEVEATDRMPDGGHPPRDEARPEPSVTAPWAPALATIELQDAIAPEGPSNGQVMDMLVGETELVEPAGSTRLLSPDDLPPLAPINLNRLLLRLSIILAAIIVIINIPFNQYGTNLARAMPDQTALVIRDGLVLQGDGDEIYVLENNELRWISTLDAFHYYGYRWEQVRQVDDAFLAQFDEGYPIHELRRCSGSPHVYGIEGETKRWIKDIDTFVALGYVWDDVKFATSCDSLRALADGPPIPPDAGTPPEP